MFIRVIHTISLAGLIAAACFATNPAWATAIAHSELSFHDVTITPAVGSVLFTGPWILQAQASANDSVSGFDSSFDEKIGPNTAIASAAVTYASASGQATDPAPTPPYLDISGNGTADAEIPDQINASAIAQGSGTVRRDDPFLPSYFEIFGGTPGDPVSVNFGVLIDYDLSVTTDQFGVLAEAEATFRQELFGADVGFVLVNTFFDFLRIGPNDHKQKSATVLPLTNTLVLHYGTPYALLMEADAEVRVINTTPEPATLLLMALALPALCRNRRA